MSEPKGVSWADPATVEAHNASQGLSEEPRHMSVRRFKEIARRNAEWQLINFEHLDADQVEAARIMMYDMRYTVGELIADRMARRPWWRKVLGL